MRTRSLVITSLLLVVMLVTAGGVYAIDTSNKRLIADGVTVSGIDVGGMDSTEARAKLQQTLLDPLQEPVTVRFKSKRFRLTPRQAKVGIDLDGSVDRALARSREGNMLTRAVREVRGQRLDADVPVDVSYSKAAIRRMVERVSETVSKPAKDAKASFEGGNVSRTRSENGRKLRSEAALRRDIDEKLLAVDGSKTVRVRTKVVKPEVTTAKLADKYPAVVVVDRKNFKLSLYKNLKLSKTYGIAVGKIGAETPAGKYSIANKAVNPAWNVPNSDWAGALAGQVIPSGAPNNPLKARWLGIYDGVGIHGTAEEDSIGSNASRGCIRMRVAEVKALYDDVPVGSPVYIL